MLKKRFCECTTYFAKTTSSHKFSNLEDIAQSMESSYQNSVKFIDEKDVEKIAENYGCFNISSIEDLKSVFKKIEDSRSLHENAQLSSGINSYHHLLARAFNNCFNIVNLLFNNLDYNEARTSEKEFYDHLLQYEEKYSEIFKDVNLSNLSFEFDYGILFLQVKVALNSFFLETIEENISIQDSDLHLLHVELNNFNTLIKYYSKMGDCKEILDYSVISVLNILAINFKKIPLVGNYVTVTQAIESLFIIEDHLNRFPINEYDRNDLIALLGEICLYIHSKDEININIWSEIAENIIRKMRETGVHLYKEDNLYKNLRIIVTFPHKGFLAPNLLSEKSIDKFVNLKNEFCIGSNLPLEEKQENAALRAMASFVTKDISHLKNIESIIIQTIEKEIKIKLTIQVFSALAQCQAWNRIIEMGNAIGLDFLREKDSTLFPYLYSSIAQLRPLETEDETRLNDSILRNDYILAAIYSKQNNQKEALRCIEKIVNDILDDSEIDDIVVINAIQILNYFYENHYRSQLSTTSAYTSSALRQQIELAKDFLIQNHEKLLIKLSPIHQLEGKENLLKMYLLLVGYEDKAHTLLIELAQADNSKYVKYINISETFFKDEENKLSFLAEFQKIRSRDFDQIKIEFDAQKLAIELDQAASTIRYYQENQSTKIIIREQTIVDKKISFYDFKNKTTIILTSSDYTTLENSMEDIFVYCDPNVYPQIECQGLKNAFKWIVDNPSLVKRFKGENGIKPLGGDCFEIKLTKQNPRIFGYLTDAFIFLGDKKEEAPAIIKLILFQEYVTDAHQSFKKIDLYKQKVKNWKLGR